MTKLASEGAAVRGRRKLHSISTAILIAYSSTSAQACKPAVDPKMYTDLNTGHIYMLMINSNYTGIQAIYLDTAKFMRDNQYTCLSEVQLAIPTGYTSSKLIFGVANGMNKNCFGPATGALFWSSGGTTPCSTIKLYRFNGTPGIYTYVTTLTLN